MKIALLGGTGDIGKGLALRWARDTDHSIVVGSRDPEKAEEQADRYATTIAEAGADAEITGTGNGEAAAGADVVVLSVPTEYATATVEAIAADLTAGTVLVSPAVSMERTEAGFRYTPPEAGSVAEEIAAAAPEDVPIVGAYQNLAAGMLSDLKDDLAVDVVVTGDDAEAKAVVASLTEEIDGLRALDGGPLAATAAVESLTPLLINLTLNNEAFHDLGVRFR